MNRLALFVVASNIFSLSSVYLFELIFGHLHINFLSDYAFYSMLLLLGCGTLFSFSGHKVGYSDPSNVAGVAASSLIENDKPKSTVVTRLESTSLGGKFFISSIFPLVFCLFA
ncbi:TPA: hypothetical protein RQJ75_004268 [Vibrio vulnificus]|nr:hypothetical protein [Vibrio vulnificus]HDY7653287.1 hypothetical protein [Vibrio vulnificus]